MKKIRLLSDFEIGCIAAGEVIENTSSIIKELVENAIDSKATEIKIFFKQGGMEEIIIIDNGCGISYDDLSMVFLPHTTSKLVNIDQLYFNNNIFFGFRGEALASIAAVSRVSIISREYNSVDGFSIIADHGRLLEIQKSPSNVGTTVIVKNLFENIPVRKKYLSSIKNQEKNILYMITGLVLSNPKISFIIYKDDKLYKEYNSVNSFLDRSYQLINQDRDKYLSVDYEDIYFKLNGLISVYEYGFYDRSKIFILANNRLIKQYKITQSCVKAYNADNFLKKYPELYLSITVNSDQIDVNVHPRKEEVLFLYQKKIEQLLTEVLEKILEDRTKKIFSEQIHYPNPIIDNNYLNKFNIFEKEDKNTNFDSKKFMSEKIDNELKETPINSSFIHNIVENKKIEIKPIEIKSEECIKSEVIRNNFFNKNSSNINDKEGDLYNKLINEDKVKLRLVNQIQPSLFDENNDKLYIGILANTYILFLEHNSILFIDQHALHEKILYEQYIENFKKQKCLIKQQLLFEEHIDIDQFQKDLLVKEKAIFNSLGIDYNVFDNFVKIKSLPINFLKFNISDLVLSYLILLFDNKDKTFLDKQSILLHEMAALYGCKNAIKAGDKLDNQEIDILIKAVSFMKNGTYCPHGRPIYYQMTMAQLNSLFKRT